MVDLAARALQYAEDRWEEILGRIGSSFVRGMMKNVKQPIIDILRDTYLAGAKDRKE